MLALALALRVGQCLEDTLVAHGSFLPAAAWCVQHSLGCSCKCAACSGALLAVARRRCALHRLFRTTASLRPLTLTHKLFFYLFTPTPFCVRPASTPDLAVPIPPPVRAPLHPSVHPSLHPAARAHPRPMDRSRRRARRAGLRTALRMLAPPRMAPARRFVLRRDAATDLAVLTDPGALAHTPLISAETLLAGGAGAGIAGTFALVPFVNVAHHNLGVAVFALSAVRFPPGIGDAAAPLVAAVDVACCLDPAAVARVPGALGAPCAGPDGPGGLPRAPPHPPPLSNQLDDDGDDDGDDGDDGDDDDDVVGEGDDPVDADVVGERPAPQPLPRPEPAPPSAARPPAPATTVSSRRYQVGRYVRDERTGEIMYVMSGLPPTTVTIMWIGPPQGAGRRVRKCISIQCDAALFARGKIVTSVLRSETTVRVQALPAVRLQLPTSATDLTPSLPNMRTYAGPFDGYIVPHTTTNPAPHDAKHARHPHHAHHQHPPRRRRPRIDLAAGRHIFSGHMSVADPECASTARARTAVLAVTAQQRIATASPTAWGIAPLLDAFAIFVARAHRGDAGEALFRRAERDLTALLQAGSLSRGGGGGGGRLVGGAAAAVAGATIAAASARGLSKTLDSEHGVIAGGTVRRAAAVVGPEAAAGFDADAVAEGLQSGLQGSPQRGLEEELELEVERQMQGAQGAGSAGELLALHAPVGAGATHPSFPFPFPAPAAAAPETGADAVAERAAGRRLAALEQEVGRARARAAQLAAAAAALRADNARLRRRVQAGAVGGE